MKINKKIPKIEPPKGPRPSMRIIDGGKIEISHSQSVKQSLDWQLVDGTYGVRFTVDAKNLDEGFALAENLVADLMAAKIVDNSATLEQLSRSR